MKNNKPYVAIKIIAIDGKVKSIASRKIRKIMKFIKANNFQNCVIKVAVIYGPGFSNKGVYKTKENFVCALKAFLESEP